MASHTGCFVTGYLKDAQGNPLVRRVTIQPAHSGIDPITKTQYGNEQIRVKPDGATGMWRVQLAPSSIVGVDAKTKSFDDP